jgi:hypothetical protein
MQDPTATSPTGKSTQPSSEAAEAIDHDSLVRVLGPAADAVGEALRLFTNYRLRNARRILERAAAKSRSAHKNDMVNPRVAHVLLEDGSYCDDELMADYLGGVLVGSRAPQGRDDRAVAWSKVITSLSSLQVRAHYLLYREWAARLRIIAVYELGMDSGRSQATMEVSSSEFAKLLVEDSEVDENDAMSHSIGGLVRAGLLDDKFFYDRTLVRVMPSIMGIELYGWAQGLAGLSPRGFAAKAQPFELPEAVPRMGSVIFPKLPERVQSTAHAGRLQTQVQRQRRRAKPGETPDP